MMLKIWKSSIESDNNWYAYLDELINVCEDDSDYESMGTAFCVGRDINNRPVIQSDGIIWFLRKHRSVVQPRIVEAVGVDGLVDILLDNVSVSRM